MPKKTLTERLDKAKYKYEAKKGKSNRTMTGQVMREVGKQLGQLIGGLVPYPGASTTGGIIGKGAGAMLSKATGNGDYVIAPFAIKSNSVYSQYDLSQQVPQFKSGKKKTTICHREYVGDVFSGPTLVSGSTPYNVTYYPINPGVGTLFPWLSGIAQNYECYSIKGMIVELKSMSADALNSTNTALGTMGCAVSYNAANSNPFINKQAVENYEYGMSCKPSQSLLFPVECARNQTVLSEMYVRTGQVPSGQDPRMYDLGNLAIFTQGMQAANVNLCELWITYEIEFFKAKNLSAIGGAIDYGHWATTAQVSNTQWFPSTAGAYPNNTLSLTFGGTTCTFPTDIIQGNYIFHFVMYAASALASQPPSITYTSNCKALSLWNLNAYNITQASLTTQSKFEFSFGVTITGPGAVITLSGGTAFGTVQSGDIIVTQIVSPAS